MMFGGCRNFKTSSLVLYFLENVKIQVKMMKCIMQPLYNFLKMCNWCIAYHKFSEMMFEGCAKHLCIPITINLFLPMSRWCL